MEELETKRLILRKFEYKDIEDLYEYAKDEEVNKYELGLEKPANLFERIKED